ncbi:MAG TPA: hypothetical protein VMV29_02235 [Ktedonobacterales bacterium]|nr:hypothetical protein [Ktedonobacterales bacterium]
MTSIERTAYPRFAHSSTAAELHAHYTPSPDDLRFAQRAARRIETLDRLTQHIRALVNRGLFARILDRLTPDDQQRLDALLERGVNPSRAPFAHPSRQRCARRRREKTVRLPRAEQASLTESDLDAGAAGDGGDDLAANAPYGAVYSAFQRLKEPPQSASVSQLREVFTDVVRLVSDAEAAPLASAAAT